MPIALVTGANGFIGSHLVRELVQRNYTVRGLVRHTSNLNSLKGANIQLYIGDVRDSSSLIEAVKDVDIVFHLAAELMTVSKEDFEETILTGTQNLLNTIHDHGNKKLQRFLYVSSQAAVGPGKDATAVDETQEAKPISWYGTSKWEAEKAVLSFANHFPVTIVRPSAVYGEREREINQVLPTVSNHIQPSLGWTKNAAVMVYVHDLVDGIIGAAESVNTIGQTYFLNHPDAMSTREVVKTMATAMDKPLGLPVPIPKILIRFVAPVAEMIFHFTRNRPPVTRDKALELSQRYWIANPSKAKKDFGWEAKHNLLSGMKPVVQHYFEEKAKEQAMTLEQPYLLWFKYVLVGIALGTLIEITSALGQFYSFTPSWLVIIVILGAFGFALSTIAMLLRRTSLFIQLIVGWVIAGVVELVASLELIPDVGWQFAPGWPLGINDIYLRSLILGLAGGIFVILVNLIMIQFYKLRLRFG